MLTLDRVHTREVVTTQELVASMLGVRREGITEAAGNLQRDGVINYRRGHITVLDRSALEARACECYSVVRAELGRLLSDVRGQKSIPADAREIAHHWAAGTPALRSEGRTPRLGASQQCHLR